MGQFESGNGFDARIDVDGTTRWSRHVPPRAGARADWQLEVDVAEGAFVDFVVSPRDGDDQGDVFRFHATIRR